MAGYECPRLQTMNTIVVGITGGSCSGKTYLANLLTKEIRSHNILASYLSQDWYYRDLSNLPRSQRDYVNFDQPEAVDLDLFDLHLSQLKLGGPILAPSYDYIEHVRLDNGHAVTPAEILVVDGLFLFVDERRRNFFEVRVYLSVPDDIRLIRRIKRDVFDCGFSLEYVLDYWEKMTRPMHELHVAPTAKYVHLNLNYWETQVIDQAFETLKDLIAQKMPIQLQMRFREEFPHGE